MQWALTATGLEADLEGIQGLEGHMQQPWALDLGEVAEQELSGAVYGLLQGLEGQLLGPLELRHDAATHISLVAARVLLQLEGVGLHGTSS